MSETKRNYELAFHINPNLEESRIAAISNELKEKLTAGQAVITFTREPERQRLSYDIQHHAQSYFGYIQFNMENGEGLAGSRTSDDSASEMPEVSLRGLAGVEEYIKLNNDILRSVILRLPSDAEKSQAIMRQAKARERIEKKAKAAMPKVAPLAPAQNEELDKELEDIIEKL